MCGNNICKQAGRTRWAVKNSGFVEIHAAACAHHFQCWYIFLLEGGKYIEIFGKHEEI